MTTTYDSKLRKKNEITLPNSFTVIGRRDPLSSTAQKIEAYSIMKIDTHSSSEFPTVTIDRNLLSRMGVDSSSMKREMENSYQELLDYKIQVTLANGNKFWTHLCSGVEEVIPGYKYKLSFHPELKPMFLKLKGDFAQISFDTVLGISSSNYTYDLYKHIASAYSKEIYILKKKGIITEKAEFQVEIDLLKNILGCANKYKKTAEFKRRVLEPSVNAISLKTDLQVTYKPIKNGRSIAGYHFTINKQEFTPFFNFSGETDDILNEVPAEKEVQYEIPQSILEKLKLFSYSLVGKAKEFMVGISCTFDEELVVRALDELDKDLKGMSMKIRGGAIKTRIFMYLDKAQLASDSELKIASMKIEKEKVLLAKKAYQNRLDSEVDSFILFKDTSEIRARLEESPLLQFDNEKQKQKMMENFLRFEVEQLVVAEIGTEADFIEANLAR
ncbi:MAG: replication initiation protein [Lentisphaeraceae bacterium]|nr:replication initiation protein [Lentisphaeraceae bacterium]